MSVLKNEVEFLSTSLAGKIAVVSGANQGIGAAVAVRLAELGADVFVTYFRGMALDEPGLLPEYIKARQAGADITVEACRSLGRRASVLEIDLSNPAAPAQIFEAAEAALGPVDILINNASAWRADTFGPSGADSFGRHQLERVSAASMAPQFLVDAQAGALMISEFAGRLIERGGSWGRIVGLTSGGEYGFPEEASYGAAKAALENYTMTAASELADLGVTANTVHPPITDTGWITPEVEEFVRTARDHTYVADPADVAGVIAWLCTDEAKMVTGNCIRMR